VEVFMLDPAEDSLSDYESSLSDALFWDIEDTGDSDDSESEDEKDGD